MAENVTVVYASTPETGYENATALGNNHTAGPSEHEHHIIVEVTKWIVYIVPPILFTFGIAGNTLSMAVHLHGRLRVLPATPYLVALAMADTLVLCVGVPHWWLEKAFTFNLRNTSDAGCKVHVFLTYLFPHISAWILVVVTVQRLASVCFPLKVKSLVTRNKNILTLVSLSLIMTVIDAPMLWAASLTDGQCGLSSFGLTFWPAYVWMDFTLANVAPFIIILISNLIIICKVLQAKRAREVNMNVQDQQNDQVVRLTLVLLTISFVFLLCISPATVYYIFESYKLTPHEEMENFLHAIIHTLLYLNNAINFILYCVTGPIFREELLRIGCKRAKPGAKENGKDGSSSNSTMWTEVVSRLSLNRTGSYDVSCL